MDQVESGVVPSGLRVSSWAMLGWDEAGWGRMGRVGMGWVEVRRGCPGWRETRRGNKERDSGIRDGMGSPGCR